MEPSCRHRRLSPNPDARWNGSPTPMPGERAIACCAPKADPAKDRPGKVLEIAQG
jgi:hypothetical protein